VSHADPYNITHPQPATVTIAHETITVATGAGNIVQEYLTTNASEEVTLSGTPVSDDNLLLAAGALLQVQAPTDYTRVGTLVTIPGAGTGMAVFAFYVTA
jgi:hypothetical protein